MCNFSGPPTNTPTFLTPDSLRRFTNTDCEDHECMCNTISTHHQLLVMERSAVITKKEAFNDVLTFFFFTMNVAHVSKSEPATSRGSPCVRYVRPKPLTSRVDALLCEASPLPYFTEYGSGLIIYYPLNVAVLLITFFTLLYLECIKKKFYKGTNHCVQ